MAAEPWRIIHDGDSLALIDIGEHRWFTLKECLTSPFIETEALADLIVRAVNSHDALVAALATAEGFFTWLAGFNGEDDHRCPSVKDLIRQSIDLRDQAEEALALAKGADRG